MESEINQSRIGELIARIGLWLVVTLVMIRASVEHDGFPWWMADPFVFSPPVVGLTPSKAILLNLAVVGASSLTILGLWLKRLTISLVAAGCFAIGCAWIAHHAFHSIESLLVGSNLLAIVCVFLVASCAHKVGDAQRMLCAICIGFVMLLLVVGAYEVLVIHPQTLANYEQTRDSFLGARGWSPGSFEALAYERRLSQAEPLAWFGLTNVYASFAASGAAVLLALAWFTKGDRTKSVVLGLCGLAALAGLVMSGAKGGIGAFGLGMIISVLVFKAKPSSITKQTMVLSCMLVIIGIALRGMIGERVGELSLLFRSHYLVGSLRMFFEHPVFGVGPNAFQEHYAIVKPSLSPEDVASPHNLPFELIATLGLGGLAIIGLFVRRLTNTLPTRNIPADEEPTKSSEQSKRELQVVLLSIAIAAVISIRFGAPAMHTELLGVQLAGSLLWTGLAMLILKSKIKQDHLQRALFVGALVLMIHAMIEVTSTWMVSGMLWAMLVGISVRGSDRKDEQSATSHSNLSHGVIVFGMLGAMVVIGLGWPTVERWESELEFAAVPAIEVARERELLDGRTTPELNRLEYDGRALALEHLIQAAASRPTHMPTLIAASSQMLWFASVHQSMGQFEQSQKDWLQAIELLEAGVEHSTGTSGYHWLGTVCLGLADTYPAGIEEDAEVDSEVGHWLAMSRRAWELAFERSPHNPHLALKLMDLAIRQGDKEGTVQWAILVVRLNQENRLDPLRGVSEGDFWRANVIILNHGLSVN